MEPLADQRLLKAYRLLRPAEFKASLAEGKRLHGQGFTVVIRANQQTSARLGLAIAKKQLRFAHQRNRLKRLIREQFRQHRSALPPCDLVFMAKAGVSEMSNDSLHRSLSQVFSRIIAGAVRRDPSASSQGTPHA
ncbi:ribonuclease P protein component [Permianibacter aggregans]|uniref:Ribonuclease P protein component n=1 Tax=Permianibacter aggregans TaxID=1510150 RepID=A0A4V3D6C8_9GAMM|nr:ribonuclease P protein component [Permianibacter aggregans]QGX39869.1 ribonuclease P protein component [Permianibacter aggregans]TDQ43417.1 ribonuclease P protein component [Permianibacter aggregans]